VTIAIGSDDYRGTSTGEARALAATGIWSNRELLSMWTETTARAIFPNRRIGRLADGDEASLLVLDGNPLDDLAALGRIRLRIKQGMVLDW
jgi:imidazolonepropionase-like amidohydrolase